VNRDQTPEQATRDILDNQLPLIEAEMDSGRLTVDNIDVFCEKSVFNIAQTRRILQAGIEMGLNVNFHGDELHPMGAAEVGSFVTEAGWEKHCLGQTKFHRALTTATASAGFKHKCGVLYTQQCR